MSFRIFPVLKPKVSKFRVNNTETKHIKTQMTTGHYNVPRNDPLVGKVRTIIFFVFFFTQCKEFKLEILLPNLINIGAVTIGKHRHVPDIPLYCIICCRVNPMT